MQEATEQNLEYVGKTFILIFALFSKDTVSQNLNSHKEEKVSLIRFTKFGSSVYGVLASLLPIS